jgi:hypothetical protein
MVLNDQDPEGRSRRSFRGPTSRRRKEEQNRQVCL